MFSHKIFYQLKPFIPRRLQIHIRRQIVCRKREKCFHIWPIDGKAARPPQGWSGWPDGKKFALVLMHDVDTEKGHEKCLQLMELDEKMGFRSSFNFVPERYHVSSEVRRILTEKGFEVGVHGLKHDGKLFLSRERFEEQAARINYYLNDWQSVGFVSPSMHRNLEWIHELNIEYDASTFDTDPFEPQPEGVGTIFPFWVPATPNPQNLKLSTQHSDNGYIELPYTLPQDFTLFVIMREKNIDIWKKKLDWIAENGGMAVLITHPDYMSFNGKKPASDEYPAEYYKEFLEYIKRTYGGQYWNVSPRDVALFWRQREPHKRKTTFPHKSGVTLIDPIKDPRWDAFVENHPFGWICHLSGWKHVLEKSFPHMKGYYLALLDDTNHQLKAGMPVFEVESWLTGKRLVSIPFATLCDPLISSSEEMRILFDSALNLSKKFGGSYIEIRTLSSPPLIQEHRLGDSRFYKHHYLLLENEPEQLKRKFHRTCVRQRISRAIEGKLTLRVADDESDLHSFYQLHVRTRKKLCLPTQPYNFFKLLWDTFSPTQKMMVLLAEKEEKTIASLILFKFKDRVSAEFSASDETFRDLSPNHFLFWEGIKSAYHDGYKIFDFGRTSLNNASLLDFKRHWGTQIVDLPHYYYPKQVLEKVNRKEESFGFRLVKKMCEKAPDHAFKYIGDFCYRHLG